MSLSPDMLGPYRIVRQVAVGGMAEIYLAQQRGLEGLARDVIIKKILPDHVDNPEFVAMFLDEARILASLNHPHIAQVLDLGKTDTGHYMVMEYVRGPTLKMLLGRLRRKRIPFPRPEALGIAMHIAEALHYAHRLRDEIGRPRGIVHRDLNPSNVILSYDGAAKLIDFGIAKASSKVHETRTGVIKGTFGYTAPEQLTGKPVDPRADIFCLGVLLYESCCNRHPFEASDEPDLLQRILNADYRRPSEVDSSIPSELDALISKCMAPKPEQRPKSMEAVIEGLSAFMARAGIVSTLAAISKFLHQAIPDDLQPSFVPTAAPARKRDVREPTMRKIPLDSVADASAGPSASTAQGSPSRPRPLASTAEGSLSRPRPLASTAEGSNNSDEPDDTLLVAGSGEKHAIAALQEVAAGEERTEVVPVLEPELLQLDSGERTSVDALVLDAETADEGTEDPTNLERRVAPTADGELRIDPPKPAPRTLRRPDHPRISTNPREEATMHVRRKKPRYGQTMYMALGVGIVLGVGLLAFVIARELGGQAPETSVTDTVGTNEPAPAPRHLRIVSEPEGATVEVNEQVLSEPTPVSVALPAEVTSVWVRVHSPGYRTQEREILATVPEARFVLPRSPEVAPETKMRTRRRRNR